MVVAAWCLECFAMLRGGPRSLGGVVLVAFGLRTGEVTQTAFAVHGSACPLQLSSRSSVECMSCHAEWRAAGMFGRSGWATVCILRPVEAMPFDCTQMAGLLTH